MHLRPVLVVIISTLTERGAEVTMRALELGVVDSVAKPRIGLVDGINDLASQIADKVRVAAQAHVRLSVTPAAITSKVPVPASGAPHNLPIGRLSTGKLICIGALTGGTEAIKQILTRMSADSLGIVITQHMSRGSPPVLLQGWTACARLRSRKPRTVSGCFRGTPLLRQTAGSSA